jgi:hypothetical protein
MNTEITHSECNELKTLKYNTMVLNKVSWTECKSSINLVNLDKFLEDEKIINSNEPWSKLDKTAKIKKLALFADAYKITNNLSEEEYIALIVFLRDCLDRKKLQRVKDVNYNKETGEVKEIPSLHHTKPTNHFTLKNIDKRVSVTRSLAPKKIKKTIKNNINNDSDSDHE